MEDVFNKKSINFSITQTVFVYNIHSNIIKTKLTSIFFFSSISSSQITDVHGNHHVWKCKLKRKEEAEKVICVRGEWNLSEKSWISKKLKLQKDKQNKRKHGDVKSRKQWQYLSFSESCWRLSWLLWWVHKIQTTFFIFISIYVREMTQIEHNFFSVWEFEHKLFIKEEIWTKSFVIFDYYCIHKVQVI